MPAYHHTIGSTQNQETEAARIHDGLVALLPKESGIEEGRCYHHSLLSDISPTGLVLGSRWSETDRVWTLWSEFDRHHRRGIFVEYDTARPSDPIFINDYSGVLTPEQVQAVLKGSMN